MEKEKQLLMDDFRKKLFSDQKELLLEMLSKLYGTRQVVTDLGNMVHNLQDTTRSDILIEVYDILLDAVYSVQTDQMNTSIEDIEKVKNVLLKMKKQEEEEREKEQKSQNIESILDTL